MKGKLWLVVIGLTLALAAPAPAQDFPKKQISLIVPYAAGGSTDVLARALAKLSAKHFPVQILVVNQAGGAGIPGRVAVVNSKPDGYNLLFGYGSGEDLVTPHTMKIPYDQFKDLVPVCQISIVSLILSVPSNHPAKTLREFVDWAKKQNRLITGAVSTRGASVDITMQAIMKVAEVKSETIPFRGGAEAVTAVLGGHTDFSGNTPLGGIAPREGRETPHPGGVSAGAGPHHSRCAHLHGAGLQRLHHGGDPGDRGPERDAGIRGQLPGIQLQESDRGPGISRYRQGNLPSGHVPGAKGLLEKHDRRL